MAPVVDEAAPPYGVLGGRAGTASTPANVRYAHRTPPWLVMPLEKVMSPYRHLARLRPQEFRKSPDRLW